MKKEYKVVIAGKYGRMSKWFADYDEAAEKYNAWVEMFDEKKANGEPVLHVTFSVFESGALSTIATHF